MSFGGFGFGQNNNNNNQQNTGFGGFGQNTQPTGFGSSGGFGATNTNTGGGLFGSSSSGFGTGGTGFGSNTSTGFGAPKPAFGAATTSSGGLFGSTATNTANSGAFGGFGSNANNNNNSTTFGASSSGGLFGQNKPAFGAATNNTSGSLFGGGGSSAFGGTTQTGGTAFGSTTGGFGAGASQQNQTNGTGSVQFEAHREKEGTQTSLFQSITMQQPYQQFSFEELRLADYQQGKRYGNSNGQAGAFGQSTGFGGFGSTNNNNSSSGGGLFGGQQQQQQAGGTGFGSTSGGLFGAKPATGGGLFGSTPASSAPSGGLFGGAATSGGFGSGTSTGFGSGASTGGGLFGAQQNKPAFGGFGQSSTPAFGQSTAGTGFGQTATSSAGGGLFGGGGTTSFGQQQTTGTGFGGGFGTNNQQQQQQNQSGGGLFGGGGFGANQQQQPKPGGLFGSTQPAAGGGLFGSQPQQQQSGGLFGNTANNQQQSGGLFGSKPAATGSNLFGSTTTANPGGGLFGNLSQQNQPAGGGLFGATANNQQQQQQKPSLFGGLGQSTSNGTGGGLFGNLGQSTASQPQGGSLFGGTQQPQQQQSGGLFGGSLGQSQQPQPQQPPQLTASLLGVNPYGNDQLFASLGTSAPSPGPIATPLSGQPKPRKPALLPQHKMSSLAASRLITPQKRTGGFGFSYSTYGTPGSAIGTPTGLGSSLLNGGSLGRSLSKSYSTSNLRNIYNAETSNLAPGLFTPGRTQYGSGNMKRLSINRSLDTRRSLFNEDGETPRKRVLFEDSTPNGNASTNGALNGTSGALIRTEEESPMSTVANSPQTNGQSNGTTNQSNGSLGTVPEDDQPVQPPLSSRPDAAKEHARRLQIDQNAGDYWSRPSIKELQNMSRGDLKHVNLVVGRDGIGQIDFGQVDLSDTPLDKLLGQIVHLEMRHATVYGDTSNMQKPARGKALNVPSEITLENSWPRKSGGRTPVYEKNGALLDKHLVRLKRVNGAEFVNYDANTGAWTFRVQHYTTYGLDYDEEDTMMSGAVSTEVAQPSASQQNVFAAAHDTLQDAVMAGGSESSPDDTFDFRQDRPRKQVPGNFDDEGVDYDDEEDSEELQDSEANTQQSFLGDGSVGALAVRDDEDDLYDYAPEDREEMAGTFPVQPTEPDPIEDSPIRPKSILKNSQLGRSRLDTPSKNRLILEANWTEQLQRTASPRKQTRQALRESQAAFTTTKEEKSAIAKPLSSKTGFSTSIDIMNALFGPKEPATTSFNGKEQSADGKGFEWPYAKRAKTSDAFAEMDEHDAAFHKCMKPSWGPDGRLVYATPADAPTLDEGIFINIDDSIIGEHADIRFGRFVVPDNLLTRTVRIQQANTTMVRGSLDEAPHAVTDKRPTFAAIADAVDTSIPRGQEEKLVWSLASILFDDLSDADFSPDMPPAERKVFTSRRRKDALSQFWRDLTRADAEKAVFNAATSEEKALHYLSAGDVPAACRQLMAGGNLKLAAMVAQARSSVTPTGLSVNFQQLVQKQLKHWDENNTLSEMNSAIRAIYEILAGNCKNVPDKAGPVEDRIRGFSISERFFGLDWKRAFGLRLWYETQLTAPIESAVFDYYNDTTEGEKAQPWSAYARRGRDDDDREDLLWRLLQVYAAQEDEDVDVRLEEAFFELANVSDSPTDARLSWQLLQICRGKGILGAKRDDGGSKLDFAADVLSTTYASALSSALPTASPEEQPELLYTALFALAHLSSDGGRRAAIQELLDQTAPLLASEQTLSLTLPRSDTAAKAKKPASSTASNTLAAALTSDPGLSIPREWLASSLALWAQAVDKDPAAQARHLLDAGQVNEAHAVLLHQIGPSCIVKRNYDVLREVLGGFEGREERVSGWRTGGAVYFDFVHLLDVSGRGEKAGVDAKQWKGTLARLVEGLAVMGKEMGKDASVDERAAVWEMGRVVADRAGNEKGVDKAKVLSLPLAEDASLKYTRELSLDYYRALMAGGH